MSIHTYRMMSNEYVSTHMIYIICINNNILKLNSNLWELLSVGYMVLRGIYDIFEISRKFPQWWYMWEKKFPHVGRIRIY